MRRSRACGTAARAMAIPQARDRRYSPCAFPAGREMWRCEIAATAPALFPQGGRCGDGKSPLQPRRFSRRAGDVAM
jgi:hypothetical protein